MGATHTLAGKSDEVRDQVESLTKGRRADVVFEVTGNPRAIPGAVRLARQLGPGKRIATILCDTGFRYLSTLYNREWLAAKGLPVPSWLATS